MQGWLWTQGWTTEQLHEDIRSFGIEGLEPIPGFPPGQVYESDRFVSAGMWMGKQVQVDFKADPNPRDPDGSLYCRVVTDKGVNANDIIYIPKRWLSIKRPTLPAALASDCILAHEVGLKAGPPQ